MTQQVKNRIEQIQRGEVPEGYQKAVPYIVPKDWCVQKLGAITRRISRPNKDGQDRLAYSISNQVGFVPQSEQFEGGSYQELDKSAYKIVYRGEFAYNPARINVGSIGRLKTSKEVIVSSLYVCFHVTDRVDGEYFDAWTKTQDFLKETIRNTEGSVREYLFYENFSNMKMPLPPLSEQQRIAAILTAQDTVISLCEKKIEQLKKLKKIVLQKMFPAKGQTVPEWRFKGFTAPWEQRKLGDAACIIGGNAWKSTDYSDSGEYLVVTIANVSGDVFINDAVGNHLSCDNPEGYLLDENDILVSLTGNVGRISKMTRIQGLLNQRVGKIVPNSSDVNAGFLFHVLRNPCFEKAMIDAGQGAAQKNISNSDVLNYSFLLPIDKDEQASIACYFDELDNLITLHQRKLEAEQKKKKALMQLLLTGIVRTI